MNQGPYAVIVSDLRMPGMDGIQFLSRVKELSPDSVCMMLTGHADLQTTIEVINEGNIFRFMCKPCNPDVLAHSLNSGLEQYRLITAEKRLIEQIKTLSITDPLTGCYNRGYISDRLPKEIKRAQRYKRLLSIIMCDIDHFKRVNDTYGHQAGDEVLISFAQCLNKNIRNNVDFLGRYGGEEFLIVLPETNIKGAFSLAERLRIKVSQNTIHTNKKEVYVTASFGFSSLDIPGMSKEITPEDIIRSVDEYLYQAKKEGRNKVIGGPLLLCR